MSTCSAYNVAFTVRGDMSHACGAFARSERMRMVICQAAVVCVTHPGGTPGANHESISHRCYLFEVAFVWEVTKEIVFLPLGCLHGGDAR